MFRNKSFLLLACSLLTFSCSEGGDELSQDMSGLDPVDRVSGLSKADYEEYMLKKNQPITKVETKKPLIPKPSDGLLTPQKPKIGNNKTVTLSVTDDVPIKDVFIELARLADIDIEVDPSITGGVIFKVKDKPLGEVVERLTSIAGLRYSIESGVLRIERDDPYVVNYPVNFLNINRSGSGGVSISSDVLSASEATSSGVTTGSNSAITSTYEGDLWKSVEEGLKAILGTEAETFVSINRQGGLISVRTTEENQERVGNYLKQIRDFYSAQVLIEAKVFEVQLSDQFSSGVDWSKLSILGGLGITGIKVTTPNLDSGINSGTSVAEIGFSRDGGDLAATADLIKTFGVTKTLSSPRIMSLNNQQSVFTFARNEIYFKVTAEEEVTPATDTTEEIRTVNVTSELKSIPIGIILSLQPSIDEKRNEIILNVRPTLSRTTGVKKADPGVALSVAQIIANITIAGKIVPAELRSLKSEIPEVEVRELDTMLRLSSGEVMAIGGMIEQRGVNSDTGVPFVSDIPVFGNAFKRVTKTTAAVQTVIFLKATIVPGYGVDEVDQEFYNKFSNDSRPIKF